MEKVKSLVKIPLWRFEKTSLCKRVHDLYLFFWEGEAKDEYKVLFP